MASGDVFPAPTGSGAAKLSVPTLGIILIDAGRLELPEAERVLHFAREKGLRFGEAAIELGLLTRADVDLALSNQFEYSYLERGQSAVDESLIAAYAPFTPQSEALRSLRNQLLQRWFDTDPSHRALAIISAERNEGRSYIASNMAVVFSQTDMRTLLIDADMRHPSQHRLFGLDNQFGLSTILSGRGGSEAIRRIPSLRNLSVLPVGARPPNPSELLVKPVFARFLEEASTQFDVVLLDTPAAGEFSDAQAICMRAGSALIVVRKNATRVWRVRGISDGAAMGGATLIGTVLNDYS